MKFGNFIFIAALAFFWMPAELRAAERVPVEISRALGTARGKPVSTGLVFIDGKYLKPPYRVSRVGNQIQVNDHPVTGPLVAWEKFIDTQPPSKLKTTEVEIPDDSASKAPGGEDAPAEKDGEDPAAPKDGGNAPPAAEGESAGVKAVVAERRCAAAADDLDDFNPNASDKMSVKDIPPDSEEDKARQKRAEDEKKAEEEEEEEKPKDEGEGKDGNSGVDANGDDLDPASPEGEAAAAKARAAAAKAAKPAVKTRKVQVLEGAFEMNFRAQKLLKPIDNYRGLLEATLKRGGYLFFGTNPARKYTVGRTSDAAATKELLKKLPELMAKDCDSETFCDAVRSAGLFSYINLQISQDLYRHKMDSIYLKQRRRELAEEDKLNRMMNRNGR